MELVTLATCNLGQWALDFDGNLERIKKSITIAKEQGATYRLGPELEISGYSCEDHFLEEDTFTHSWESIYDILDCDLTDGILCDIGMPISHRNIRYNCRIFLLDRKIVYIRPKIDLAGDGNYRENRWFSRWTKIGVVEEFLLPMEIRVLTGQKKVMFGDGAIRLDDTLLASEVCEELFAPESPHVRLGLAGVEIFTNGSGSHHQLRKLSARINLIKNATAKTGGVYVYANQQCCDGTRLYFDGCAMIAMNGRILAQGSQFSLKEVEVITATVDLYDVRAYRGSINSRGVQAAYDTRQLPLVDCDFELTRPTIRKTTEPIVEFIHHPMEEIAFGPSAWLWDYLRRSGLHGFFLPLSGGADSSSTAAIVGIMCKMVFKEISEGNENVLRDCLRITRLDDASQINCPEDICSRLFHTCYMGTDNSSDETELRASKLAQEIGASFHTINIQKIVDAFVGTFSETMGKTPQYAVHGGTSTENIALQNIQARSRMVLAYVLAQLLPWLENNYGTLLVLGSANVDETLRGYFTKYDCSSADLNPIGGISKVDLKSFLLWAAKSPFVHYPTLAEVATAIPTAELEPTTNDYVQSDEMDMGMSYQELSRFGILRKVYNCGPYSMFKKLVYEWDHLTPTQVAEKVKRFFFYYSINRHKTTILTPSYHAENYSPDDNRYDLRPFLYNSKWTRQFHKIDALAAKLENRDHKL